VIVGVDVLVGGGTGVGGRLVVVGGADVPLVIKTGASGGAVGVQPIRNRQRVKIKTGSLFPDFMLTA